MCSGGPAKSCGTRREWLMSRERRAGGRRTTVFTLDRAIPDRPSSSLFELTAVPAARERLRMGGEKSPTAGRPCGLTPGGSHSPPFWGVRSGRHSRPIDNDLSIGATNARSDSVALVEAKAWAWLAKSLAFARGGCAVSAVEQYGHARFFEATKIEIRRGANHARPLSPRRGRESLFLHLGGQGPRSAWKRQERGAGCLPWGNTGHRPPKSSEFTMGGGRDARDTLTP